MKTSRKILIAAGVVVGLFVLFILALPLFIDVNAYHDIIEGRAEDTLGRDVSLGKMKLSLLPFGVRVNDIAVAALPEEGGGQLLEAESVRIGARLMPLLDKRLEITGVVIERPSIVLARDAQGTWNVQRLIATEPETTPSPERQQTLEGFAIDSLRITGGKVTLRDEALNPGREFVATLDDIDLRIHDLAVDRRIRIDLSTGLEAIPGATMAFEGEVGPLDPSTGEPFRVAGELRLDDVDPDQLGALLLDAGLLETIPERFFAGREVDLAGEVDAVWSATEDGIPYVGLTMLALDLDGSKLAAKGGIWGEGLVHDVDLEMLPSEVKAEHITSLLALVIGDVPVAFASDRPVEIQAQVKGRVGKGAVPEVAGTAKLQDFTFEHPGLAQPVEELGATISIGPDQLQIDDFQAVIGSSDVYGALTMVGFETPRVTFGLRSKRADFFELFSFLSSGEGSSGPADPADSEAAEELARTVTVDGNLEIDEGSFRTLSFTGLNARMQWSDGVLILDPCSMTLYEGSFGGALTYRPFTDPPAFDLRGEADAVSVGRMLKENLDLEDVLTGSFTGSVSGRGTGVDYDSIVRSLDGGGSFSVDSGRVGGLDVLGTLSQVTGIFGEQTLSSLSQQLGDEGTEFSRATGDIDFRDAKMQLRNLAIEAPAFAMNGDGAVNLLDEQLRGDLEIVFSEAVSNSMKQEGSQAGAVFWDPDTARVQFPFTLSGPYTSPSAMVDWKGTIEKVAKRTVQRELEGLLAEQLGGSSSSEQEKAPSAQGPVSSQTGPGGLAAEITRTKWGGSFLFKDLRIFGVVRGEAIDHASLEVTDAAGAVLMSVGRMGHVESYLANAADRAALQEINWKEEVDGKKTSMAQKPITITVRVVNTAGDTAEIVHQVN
jgi:AsmA protein